MIDWKHVRKELPEIGQNCLWYMGPGNNGATCIVSGVYDGRHVSIANDYEPEIWLVFHELSGSRLDAQGRVHGNECILDWWAPVNEPPQETD